MGDPIFSHHGGVGRGSRDVFYRHQGVTPVPVPVGGRCRRQRRLCRSRPSRGRLQDDGGWHQPVPAPGLGGGGRVPAGESATQNADDARGDGRDEDEDTDDDDDRHQDSEARGGYKKGGDQPSHIA